MQPPRDPAKGRRRLRRPPPGFIQSQRETLIINAQKEQTSFLTKGKAEARIFKPG